jgi:hypothetical protein
MLMLPLGWRRLLEMKGWFEWRIGSGIVYNTARHKELGMYRCGFHSLLPASEECMHYLPHLLHLKALKISVVSSFSFEDKRETAREDFRELGSRLSIAHTVCLSLFFLPSARLSWEVLSVSWIGKKHMVHAWGILCVL